MLTCELGTQKTLLPMAPPGAGCVWDCVGSEVCLSVGLRWFVIWCPSFEREQLTYGYRFACLSFSSRNPWGAM